MPLATIAGVVGAAAAPYAAGADINSDGSSDLLLIPTTAAGEERGFDGPVTEAPLVSPESLPQAVPMEAVADTSVGQLPDQAYSTAKAVQSSTVSDTLYVDDDWQGATGDPDGSGPATAVGVDAFSDIQSAIAATDGGGDIVEVMPGVYQPFQIAGSGKDDVWVQGVDADAVFVDGGGSTKADSVVRIEDAVGVTLQKMTLRNGVSGVKLVRAGVNGHEDPSSRTTLHRLLVYDCDNAIHMDRTSTAVVRKTTLVGGASTAKSMVHVDSTPDENALPLWEALPAPIGNAWEGPGEGGGLFRAGDRMYALPGAHERFSYSSSPDQKYITLDSLVVDYVLDILPPGETVAHSRERQPNLACE